MKKLFYTLLVLLSVLSSCRKEEPVVPPEVVPVTPPEVGTEILGFYLLNEGNSGTNKATLDFMNLTTGEYHRNIYGDANPSVPKELGDTGNDIAIYGGKLYAVINRSNKVEVMNRLTAERVGQVDIPNCRYVTFHGGYAYITSYAGPVEVNPNYQQRGYVAKVDTASLEIVDRCLVGFQPDELEVVGNKIYVANSGGYMFPNYESTVSVIDIETFSEINRIEVAQNLHRLQADRYGKLWVSSRGNYYDTPPRLHWIDTHTDTYEGTVDIAVSGMTLSGDSLYIYGASFSYITFEWETVFGIVNAATKQVVTRNFLSNGADNDIEMPYGIEINPLSGDIYLTDAANHVYPGMLFCFDRGGNFKWKVQTGDVPAHFAILYK